MKFFSCVLVIAIMLVISAGPTLAQKQNMPGYKDPKTAVAWSYLLPGAGHMYAGEAGKGLLLMG